MSLVGVCGMLRVLVILIGCLIGASAYETMPDPATALAALKRAPVFTTIEDYALTWKFVAGLGAGLVAGEILRVLWRYAKMTSHFVQVIGGRAVQYAAIASVIGIVIYFVEL